MYDHIIVTGNGKTSRANVEALVDDYIHANPKITFTLANPVRLSEGQVWLKQYLDDKEIKFTTELTDPKIAEENSAMFILWDDEDPESANCLAIAKEHKIPAFDLTDGLVSITPTDGLVVVESPKIPEKEQISESNSKELEEDEEDEDGEYEDPLYEAIRVVANIFAEAIAEELNKVLKR